MQRAAWRIIHDGASDGAWNMAVDAALARSRSRGAPPTLRLYAWSRPTASLGRFQPIGDVDLDACADAGVDVVRRPTGGRGVLHDDELTYSVVAAEEDGVPRGVVASYRHFGTALVAAYTTLGIPAEVTASHAGRPGSAACYLAATQADLSLAGAKLSGSAQVWTDGVCLQHGSFVVARDVARESAVFRLDAAATAALASEAVTISGAVGRSPEAAEIREAVTSAFASTFGIRLVEAGLTAEERDEALKLRERFALSGMDVGG